MTDVPPRDERSIEDELGRLQEKAETYGRGYLKWRRQYERLTYVLGIPSALSAGAATVTALKDVSPTIVALLAGVASALTAIQLFVRPADRAARNRSQHVEFDQLAFEIEVLRKHKLASLSTADAVAELERLGRAFFDLERRAMTPLA